MAAPYMRRGLHRQRGTFLRRFLKRAEEEKYTYYIMEASISLETVTEGAVGPTGCL